MSNQLIQQTLQTRNKPLTTKKQAFRTKNRPLTTKNRPSGQVVSIENQLFDEQKAVVSVANQLFETLLLGLRAKTTTNESMIKLYRQFGFDNPFARADIMKIIGVTSSPAGALIDKLKSAGLIPFTFTFSPKCLSLM